MSVLVTQSLNLFTLFSFNWPPLEVWDCYLVLILSFVPIHISILITDPAISRCLTNFATHWSHLGSFKIY